MPTYYSIDETAARRAKEMNSHFGYKPGGEIIAYQYLRRQNALCAPVRR
jgi:hypothetical protein